MGQYQFPDGKSNMYNSLHTEQWRLVIPSHPPRLPAPKVHLLQTEEGPGASAPRPAVTKRRFTQVGWVCFRAARELWLDKASCGALSSASGL